MEVLEAGAIIPAAHTNGISFEENSHYFYLWSQPGYHIHERQ